MRTLQNTSEKDNELECNNTIAFTSILIFNGIHLLKACTSSVLLLLTYQSLSYTIIMLSKNTSFSPVRKCKMFSSLKVYDLCTDI